MELRVIWSFLVIIGLLKQAAGQNMSVDHFYPFGLHNGDSVTAKSDDGGSPKIFLSSSFSFFGQWISSLYVNNNGIISLQGSVRQFTPSPFPLADNRSLIAPFWADVNNAIAGEIYFNESTEESVLQRASEDIDNYFPGLNTSAHWVFVATWDHVAYFGSSSQKRNTFQAVLIQSGSHSFIIFNYGDIEWTTGTASGGNGNTGLGGTPAVVGFNSANGSLSYFTVPASGTDEIVNIELTSNVGEPGRWVFRTDDLDVPGGCTYEGRFVPRGDAFWMDSSCRTRCTCEPTDSLRCEQQACAAFEVCNPLGAFYACEPSRRRTCTVSGDPHYYTFDGALFHFQGTCTYVLSELCRNSTGLPSYRVEVQNENRGNTAVAWTRLVRLSFGNAKITMVKGATDRVMVDGVFRLIPLQVSTTAGQIRVRARGFTVTASTDSGLEVSYDGSHTATVSLTDRYRNNTCGLCGNMNGDRSDEFRTPEGTQVGSSAEFAISWKADGNGTRCQDHVPETVCSPEEQLEYRAGGSCGLMSRLDGPFAACAGVLPAVSFIDSCVFDLCATGGSQRTLCQAVTAFATRCQDAGVPPNAWRRDDFCEIQCPPHSHYEACGTACPASCAHSTDPLFCALACVESCQCDSGYILSGGDCVPRHQCGCSFLGSYYRTGDQLVTDTCSRRCTCPGGGLPMTCQNITCNEHQECAIRHGVRDCHTIRTATCSASGDPHYRTFDGLPFDFQGTCRYTLSELCAPAADLTAFRVTVENERRGSTAVSWTRQVRVLVYGYQVQMTRGERGSVQVDGIRQNLPVTLASGNIRVHHSGSAAVLETDLGLRVSYDWSHYVTVTVPGTYMGSLCGLCGNFNGNVTDEFKSASGEMVSSPVLFGNSWKHGNESCPEEPELPSPQCTSEQRALYSSEQYCGALINATGPFQHCQSSMPSLSAFENCVFDLCASGEALSLCQALGAYALECQGRGIGISDWRNSTGCGLECQENSDYQVCGTSCPASCSRPGFPADCGTPCQEGCQCLDGYVLSAGRCVPPAQCGCLHRGQYRMPGERFWEDEACRSRCVCEPGSGRVRCRADACQEHEACRVVNGRRRCVPSAAVCVATGDPHYRTFDGRWYDFQGACTYVLVTACRGARDAPQFRVETHNREIPGRSVALVDRVAVVVYGHEILLSRDSLGRVKVDGLYANLPWSRAEGGLTVFRAGLYTHVRTDFGLEVGYDLRHHVWVSLHRRFAGRTCGLCGNYNGLPADDYITPNGTLVSSLHAFASSWKANVTEQCEHGCQGGSCPVCEHPQTYSGSQFCGIISHANGPFAACLSRLDPAPYLQDCVYDVCLAQGDRETLCQSLQAFASACQALNVSLSPWRNDSFCGVACPENSHYEVCGERDINRCVSLPTNTTSAPCAEGCFCDHGFRLSGEHCVPSTDCGCVHNGLYLQMGQSVLNQACTERCQCHAGGAVECVPLLCNAGQECGIRNGQMGCHDTFSICVVTGDPHYFSYDGALTHFQGTCEYQVSAVCHNLTLPWFRITTENRNRGNSLVSFIYRVHVYLTGLHLQITGRAVTVGGQPVSLPAFPSLGVSVLVRDGTVVVQVGDNLEVRYDGASTLLLRVAQSYAGTLCGLCGNFNGNPADDKLLPDGQPASNDTHLGNSWRAEGGSSQCEEAESRESECTDPPPGHRHPLCDVLTADPGPFAQCHWQVDPRRYYTSCVFDTCAYGMDRLTLCRAVGAYAAACALHGFQVSSWRNATDCPETDPCDAMDCTEDEWCGDRQGLIGCYCAHTHNETQLRTFDYQLSCNGNNSSVSISRCLLFTAGFPANVLHLNDPECTGHLSHGRLQFNFESNTRACGNRLQVNSTHFTYSNTIQGTVNENIGGVITRERKISLHLACEYPLSINLSSPNITHVESTVTGTLPSGQGTYEGRMILYEDSRYSQQFSKSPIVLTLNERVYVGIAISGVDSDRFVLTMSNCWATPTTDPFNPIKWNLITNRCVNSVDGTVNMHEDGVSTVGRFSFNVFKFIEDSATIYLHCQVQLCDILTSQCSVDCTEKSVRSAKNLDSALLLTSTQILKQSTGNTDLSVGSGCGHLSVLSTLWAVLTLCVAMFMM